MILNYQINIRNGNLKQADKLVREVQNLSLKAKLLIPMNINKVIMIRMILWVMKQCNNRNISQWYLRLIINNTNM